MLVSGAGRGPNGRSRTNCARKWYGQFVVLLGLGAAACTGDEAPMPGAPFVVALQLAPSQAQAALPGTFAAVQDGDGEWRLLSGTAGSYLANVSNERFGLAFGCSLPDGRNHVVVYHSTVAERTAVADYSCYYRNSAESNLRVQGLSPDEVAVLDLGVTRLEVASDGDVLVRGHAGQVPLTPLVYSEANRTTPKRVLRPSSITLPSSGTTLVDVAGGEPPGRANLVLPSDVTRARFETGFVRVDGMLTARIGGTITSAYDFAPASLLDSGEYIELRVQVDDNQTAFREQVSYFATPAEARVVFPQPLSLSTSLVPRNGVAFLHVETAALQSSALKVELDITATTTSPSSTTRHRASVSRGWLGGDRVAYTFPDLSAFPGYSPLAKNSDIAWRVARIETSGDTDLAKTIRSAVRAGTIPN